MIILFLILPKLPYIIFIFAIALGLTGNSTVPPTSGLTARIFGAKKLAALFGVLFLAHQVGSFFSAWLGGVGFAATGDYIVIWIVSAMLCLLAAIVSLMISER